MREPDMSQRRVAVIQAGTSLSTLPDTGSDGGPLRSRCSAGVELAVFPEAYIGGYPKGLSFGAVLGSRFLKGVRITFDTGNQPLTFREQKQHGSALSQRR